MATQRGLEELGPWQAVVPGVVCLAIAWLIFHYLIVTGEILATASENEVKGIGTAFCAVAFAVPYLLVRRFLRHPDRRR